MARIQRVTYTLSCKTVAVRVVELDESGAVLSDELYYTSTDHLGSVVAVSDEAGNLVGDIIRYEPFGAYRGTLPDSTNPSITDRGFTGHKDLVSDDLIDMNARWYDSYANRFISPDTIVPNPSNPQSLNRYSYALNNPVNFKDPSGHAAVCGVAGEDCGMKPLPPPPSEVIYIYEQMLEAVQGETLQEIKSLNDTCYSCTWADVPVLNLSDLISQNASYISDVKATVNAYGKFGSGVRQNGPWDPKPILRWGFGTENEVGESTYYYDIWGNIMYGYLGAAAGFPMEDLLNGAGVEQIGSSTGYAIQYRDSNRLPRSSDVTGLKTFDDPLDQSAILAGIKLWQTRNLAVAPEDIVRAVLYGPGIESR